MSDEKKQEGIWGRLITEVVAIIPKDIRELIGFQVGIYLFVLTPMIIFGGGFALVKIFRESKEQPTVCWGLQEAGQRVFKINKCTGETIEVTPQKTSEVTQSSKPTIASPVVR